jgi:hypothetical protein
MARPNLYQQLIAHIFEARYRVGEREFEFEREDLERAAETLRVGLPKNLGDVIYSFRYRTAFPESIRQTEPEGLTWTIRSSGRAKYRFVLRPPLRMKPNPDISETKIPDSTPGIVTRYALSDEQALLAKLRYNRLIDTFTGVTCYALQSHLRTAVTGIGQTETDELYVGVDKRGAHYVFPVQAKGGSDRLSSGQIENDFAMCTEKFPDLICFGIAAQFMADDVIALFMLEQTENEVSVVAERHYRLVPAEDMTAADLLAYRERLDA